MCNVKYILYEELQDNFHTSYKIWMTAGRSLMLNQPQD